MICEAPHSEDKQCLVGHSDILIQRLPFKIHISYLAIHLNHSDTSMKILTIRCNGSDSRKQQSPKSLLEHHRLCHKSNFKISKTLAKLCFKFLVPFSILRTYPLLCSLPSNNFHKLQDLLLLNILFQTNMHMQTLPVSLQD